MNTYMVLTVDHEEFESISEVDKAKSRGMFFVLASCFEEACQRAQEDKMSNEDVLSVVFFEKHLENKTEIRA